MRIYNQDQSNLRKVTDTLSLILTLLLVYTNVIRLWKVKQFEKNLKEAREMTNQIVDQQVRDTVHETISVMVDEVAVPQVGLSLHDMLRPDNSRLSRFVAEATKPRGD